MAEFETQGQVIDCGDLDHFVTELFSQPPGLPNSQRFDLHPDDLDGSDGLDQFMFGLLKTILQKSLVFKFGANMKVSELQPEDIQLMKSYFQSFGYHIWIDDEIQQHKNEYSKIIPFICKLGAVPCHQVMFSRLE